MRETRNDVDSKKLTQAPFVAYRSLAHNFLQPIRMGVGTGWKRRIG